MEISLLKNAVAWQIDRNTTGIWREKDTIQLTPKAFAVEIRRLCAASTDGGIEVLQNLFAQVDIMLREHEPRHICRSPFLECLNDVAEFVSPECRALLLDYLVAPFLEVTPPRYHDFERFIESPLLAPMFVERPYFMKTGMHLSLVFMKAFPVKAIALFRQGVIPRKVFVKHARSYCASVDSRMARIVGTTPVPDDRNYGFYLYDLNERSKAQLEVVMPYVGQVIRRGKVDPNSPKKHKRGPPEPRFDLFEATVMPLIKGFVLDYAMQKPARYYSFHV
jgi:hypothetical protein